MPPRPSESPAPRSHAARRVTRRARTTTNGRTPLALLLIFATLAAQTHAPAAAARVRGETTTGTTDERPQSQVTPPSSAAGVDLNGVHGVASRGEDGTYALAPVLPTYTIPGGIESAAMAGTGTLADAESHVKVSGGFKKATGVFKKAGWLVNIAMAAAEAAEVGLAEGNQNADAELYLLDEVSTEYKALVERAKGKGRADEDDRARMSLLKKRLGQLGQDFDDHSTTGAFFRKSVLTEASGTTLMREAGVFLNESFFGDLIAAVLGPVGRWLGLKRVRGWVWRTTRDEVRLWVDRGPWKRLRLSQRLRGTGRAAGDYVGNLDPLGMMGTSYVGDIILRGTDPKLDDRIRLISQRLDGIRPPPPKLEIRLTASNALQAAGIIQNVALVPQRVAAAAQTPMLVAVTVDRGARVYWAQSYAPDATYFPPAVLASGGDAAAASRYVIQPSRSTVHFGDSFAFRQAGYVSVSPIKFDSKW